MKVRVLGQVGQAEWPSGRRPEWKPGAGSVVLENGRLRLQVVHVAICHKDGTPVYDRVLFWEPGGAATLLVDQQGRIGLVEVWRPSVAADKPFEPVGVDPDADRRWAESLGRTMLEAPRGMIVPSESHEGTAVREAEEEAGFVVKHVTYVGPHMGDTASTPMPAHLYVAEVDTSERSARTADPDENILGVDWYSQEEVLSMMMRGAECPIVCGFTRSLLAYWFARALLSPR